MGKRRNGCSVSFSQIAALAVMVAAAAKLPGQTPPAAEPAAAKAHGALVNRHPALIAILDEHVEFLRRTDPVEASTRGDERFDDQLHRGGPEAVAADRSELSRRLARVRALDRAEFTEADHTDADLLIYDLSMRLAAAAFSPEQIPISTMGGPQLGLPQIAGRLRFSSPRDYEAYVLRLEQVPRVIDETITQMRAGLEAGRVPPKVTMAAATAQCLAQAVSEIEDDPSASPFYKPFVGSSPDAATAARARGVIREQIVPAYRKLARFLDQEYIPACRESIGASEGVDGRAAYDLAIRRHTTLDITADEVHRIGLDEVARIRAEMEATINRTDFPGRDAPKGNERFAAFVNYLRTDPRFYYTQEEELLDGYRAICKEIDPGLASLFGTLPRNPYGVRPLPAFSAPSSPTAYYYPGSMAGGVPGYFMANTYRLDQRPRFSMIALALHEAVPGHHLQISLAQELEGQHEYRTWIGFTAFVEGWGLYAERLGLEIGDGPRGLFDDPYDDFGRLNFEMWRACRLVVDTGIHAMGWSRQKGIDFILANTALAPYDVEREVDRYIGWPGQATGYKLGELKIRELRAEAERALGDTFDLRAFHDVVLGAGAVPLPVLEARVHRYIRSVRAERAH